jgi:uncharacterized protein DUF3179
MGGVKWRSWLVALLPLVFCAAACLWINSFSSGRKGAAPSELAATTDASGEPTQYTPMRFDVPSIENPPLEYADDVVLDDDAMVIGIVVNGEARAYLREAFEMDPHRHVVTDSIDSTPVAITHCDRIRCTRVFTGPELADAKNIRVGGWGLDQTLSLLVNEAEYSQKSPKIPLADVPFLELPWGMWRELFPNSMVYLGVGGKS